MRNRTHTHTSNTFLPASAKVRSKGRWFPVVVLTAQPPQQPSSSQELFAAALLLVLCTPAPKPISHIRFLFLCNSLEYPQTRTHTTSPSRLQGITTTRLHKPSHALPHTYANTKDKFLPPPPLLRGSKGKVGSCLWFLLLKPPQQPSSWLQEHLLIPTKQPWPPVARPTCRS